jgi:predicted kinase
MRFPDPYYALIQPQAMRTQTLFVFRGAPGTGKTTMANSLCAHVFAADDFFTDKEKGYRRDKKFNAYAHLQCRMNAAQKLMFGHSVAVTNVHKSAWQLATWKEMAAEFKVDLMIINLHKIFGNVHGVSKEKVEDIARIIKNNPEFGEPSTHAQDISLQGDTIDVFRYRYKGV